MHLLRMLFFLVPYFYEGFSWNRSSLLPENFLRRNLFQDYDKNVFPMPQDNSKLKISLVAIIKSLDRVDIRSSTATLSIVLTQKWNNHQLAWNGSEFDSIPFIFSKVSNVWAPLFCQTESGKCLSFLHGDLVTISKDGSCSAPVIDQAVGDCKVDIKNYPRDVHKCNFTFYTYNLYSSLADLELDVHKDDEEVVSGAWTYTKTGKVINFHNYVAFKIEVKITRKPENAKRKILLPLLLLTLVPVLNHILPVETGERIGFSMTGLLTMMLTIQHAMDQLPETDEEPTTVFFGRMSLFLMMVSLVITAVILNIYHRKRKPMPLFMQRLLRVVCRLVLIHYPSKNAVICDAPGNEASDDWLTLARALDRIVLPVFVVLQFIVVLSSL